MSSASGAEWLEKAVRSQAIALKITELLNDLARIEPSAVQAEIHGTGFLIRGHGGNFHVDSLLSVNDIRRILDL